MWYLGIGFMKISQQQLQVQKGPTNLNLPISQTNETLLLVQLMSLEVWTKVLEGGQAASLEKRYRGLENCNCYTAIQEGSEATEWKL